MDARTYDLAVHKALVNDAGVVELCWVSVIALDVRHRMQLTSSTELILGELAAERGSSRHSGASQSRETHLEGLSRNTRVERDGQSSIPPLKRSAVAAYLSVDLVGQGRGPFALDKHSSPGEEARCDLGMQADWLEFQLLGRNRGLDVERGQKVGWEINVQTELPRDHASRG